MKKVRIRKIMATALALGALAIYAPVELPLAGISFPEAEAAVVSDVRQPFRSAKIDRNITRIRDNTGDLMYLVEGREKAALIDTGVGVGSLKAYVRTLTDKPLVVILTHGHVDHASGAAEFDEVYLSAEDRELFREHTSLANRQGYVSAGNPEWAGTLQEADYQPQADADGFKELKPGMTFDLGGTHLDIYSAPGHTHGSSAVLMRENRALLTGDAANMFTFLFAKETLGLSSYEESLKKLKAATAGKYDKVYCSHGSGDLTVDYLDQLINDCELIKAGKDDKVPFEFMGEHANIAFAIDEAHNRFDAGIGNIVYDPQRITE